MATSYDHAVPVTRTATVSDAGLMIGRIVLVLMFLFSGYGKLADLSGTAAMIASKGLPVPMLLATLAAVTEVLGGLMIVFGWQTRLAAIGLLIYTLIATYFFHAFWDMAEGPDRMNQMIHAMKNVSIIGAFLMLASTGAGRYAIDARGR